MPDRIVPLAEALVQLDSPAAVADRRKRAQKWAEELEGDARGQMFMVAGWEAIERIRAPFRTQDRLYGGALAAAEHEAGRIADTVVFEQCMIALRAQDVGAIYAEPERMSQERVWAAYTHAVGAMAWAQGNKEAEFTRRWRELIAARNDAEAYDDAAGIRSIEARLDKLTAPVKYPQYPQAGWEAADVLSPTARDQEYLRLEAKYGPRNPSSNGIGKTPRGRRQTRPMQALSTR